MILLVFFCLFFGVSRTELLCFVKIQFMIEVRTREHPRNRNFLSLKVKRKWKAREFKNGIFSSVLIGGLVVSYRLSSDLAVHGIHYADA